MKTTTEIVDEEYESLRDQGIIGAEKYQMETDLMKELYEVEVVLGRVRKGSKFDQHATVTTRKLSRIIKYFQSHNRRIQTAPGKWYRSEPSIHTGMPF